MSQHRLMNRATTILSAEFCECGGLGSVVESRPCPHGKRRRRRCQRCGLRWTTYEIRQDPDCNGLELPIDQVLRLLRWLRAGLAMLEETISRLEGMLPLGRQADSGGAEKSAAHPDGVPGPGHEDQAQQP